VSLLDGLSVTSGGQTVAFKAAYESASTRTPLPAIFVRVLQAKIDPISIDGRADYYDVRYDVGIVVLDTDTQDPELLLKDAASAVQAKVRTVYQSLGGAWNVRPVADRTLPPREFDGVMVYERVLTIRAQSQETF
jgi:hypothetical protein